MVELLRVAQGTPQGLPVFDVASVVADARVEDVYETVLAEKEVADDAHGSAVGLICPESAQVGNGVDPLLLLLQKSQKISKVHSVLLKQLPELGLAFLDEADDSLAKIFRNVLGLVFHPTLELLALVLLFLTFSEIHSLLGMLQIFFDVLESV